MTLPSPFEWRPECVHRSSGKLIDTMSLASAVIQRIKPYEDQSKREIIDFYRCEVLKDHAVFDILPILPVFSWCVWNGHDGLFSIRIRWFRSESRGLSASKSIRWPEHNVPMTFLANPATPDGFRGSAMRTGPMHRVVDFLRIWKCPRHAIYFSILSTWWNTMKPLAFSMSRLLGCQGFDWVSWSSRWCQGQLHTCNQQYFDRNPWPKHAKITLRHCEYCDRSLLGFVAQFLQFSRMVIAQNWIQEPGAQSVPHFTPLPSSFRDLTESPKRTKYRN